MQLVFPRPMQLGLNSPLELPNLAAWYSLRGDAGTGTYTKDGSNRISRVDDRSGNARHIVQATQANQPIWSTSGGFNLATFDGVNDFLKASAFTLNQPTTLYFVGSQVTWTASDAVYDGNSSNAMLLEQYAAGASPQILQYSGANGSLLGTWSLGTNAVLCDVRNGASSSLGLNRATAATGNPSTGNAGGFTVGARADGNRAANITLSEAVLFSVAHDAQTQVRVIEYLMRTWGVA